MHVMTPLNVDPSVVALENALRADAGPLHGYRAPINEVLRELRVARSKAERVDALERKIIRLSKQLEEAMRHNAFPLPENSP